MSRSMPITLLAITRKVSGTRSWRVRSSSTRSAMFTPQSAMRSYSLLHLTMVRTLRMACSSVWPMPRSGTERFSISTSTRSTSVSRDSMRPAFARSRSK